MISDRSNHPLAGWSIRLQCIWYLTYCFAMDPREAAIFADQWLVIAEE